MGPVARADAEAVTVVVGDAEALSVVPSPHAVKETRASVVPRNTILLI
jgi:hypothetical protein